MTKVLLEALFTRAIWEMYYSTNPYLGTTDVLDAYETTYRHTYMQAEGISQVLKIAAER
jgi:hypothetical protein